MIDAGVVAQQHVRELIVRVVGIAGVRAEVDVERVAPAGLLAVVVPIEVNAGFESVGAAVVSQVVGEGIGLALAAPVGLERSEVARTDAAVKRGEAIADVLIRKKLLKLEAERSSIEAALVGAGHQVHYLRKVVVGKDELVRGFRRNHVHQIPRPTRAGLLAELGIDGVGRTAEDPDVLVFLLRVVRPAKKEIHIGADVVVHARHAGVLSEAVCGREGDADLLRNAGGGGRARAARQIQQLQKCRSVFVELRCGNGVVRIGRSTDGAAGGIANDGARLENGADGNVIAARDGLLGSVRIEAVELAEVAAQDLRAGNVDEGVAAGRAGGARAFVIVEEEEFLVVARGKVGNQNGAAEIAPELIEAQLGDGAGGVEGPTRVQGVVPQEFIRRAVEGASAALGVDRDHDAGVAAVFGVEGAGLQLELAHRVQADLGVLPVVRAHVGIDGSIQEDVVAAAALSVHVEGIRVVEGQAEIAGVVRDHARQGSQQRLKIAAVQRDFRHFLRTDDERLLRRGSLHQRHLRLYRDGFGDLPYLESEHPQTHALILIQGQFFILQGFKSWRLHPDRVVAGEQRRKAENARRASNGFAGDHAFILIERRDLGVGDGGAGRIHNDPLNGAGLGRREGGCAEERADCENIAGAGHGLLLRSPDEYIPFAADFIG